MGKNTKDLENIVQFELINFTCDFNIISNLLKIKEFEAWNKGDMVSNGFKKVEAKISRWQLIQNTSKKEDIDKQVDEILNFMLPKYEQLQHIYKKYKAEAQITIVSYHNDANFGMYLSLDIIQKMNKLKTALDIDTYYLGEED